MWFPFKLVDLEERDEDDEDCDEEPEYVDLASLLLLTAIGDVDEGDKHPFISLREPAHSLQLCLNFSMKFSGNLNETLRTLPTPNWSYSRRVVYLCSRL